MVEVLDGTVNKGRYSWGYKGVSKAFQQLGLYLIQKATCLLYLFHDLFWCRRSYLFLFNIWKGPIVSNALYSGHLAIVWPRHEVVNKRVPQTERTKTALELFRRLFQLKFIHAKGNEVLSCYFSVTFVLCWIAFNSIDDLKNAFSCKAVTLVYFVISNLIQRILSVPKDPFSSRAHRALRSASIYTWCMQLRRPWDTS